VIDAKVQRALVFLIWPYIWNILKYKIFHCEILTRKHL